MRRVRGTLAGVALLSVMSTTVVPAGAQEAVSDEELVVAVDGHGWGHGRGMGQFGSLGYALNFGWSSEQILDHFYGDTVAGVQPNSLWTIRIDSANDEPTVVQVDEGSIALIDDDDNVTHVSDGRAMRLTAVDGGFVLADAPSCAGPFVDRDGVLSADQVRISTVAGGQPTGSSGSVGAGQVVTGDWDGDGDDEIALVDGTSWTLYNGTATNPVASVRETFTMPAGIPLAGDWDGDGDDTAAVFSDGTWTLGNGTSNASTLTFGQAGDVPIAGDWDGDGNTDLGVRRGTIWMLSPGGGAPLIEFHYGNDTDVPIVGDWDGDGTADSGLIRGTTWIRRIGLDDGGEPFERVAIVDSASALIGDWNGDGEDEPGTHVGATVTLGEASAPEPAEDLEARLDPFLPLEHTIQRCASSTTQNYYRGELRAVHNNGNQRTVNAVAVEAYLRAVVPLEMPASWALLGDGDGAAALEAQAVSARSYALGEDRTSYARTCDTISCQVYGGRAVRRSGTLTVNEHPLADIAIESTTGVVRMRGNSVARTEFSSSTGGWTAGGVFPAVEDLGDDVDRNPNHDWTEEIDVSDIEARWSNRQLDRIFISESNGLGEDGGRALEVTLVFGDETFTISGNDFRRAFGLLSDFFTVDWVRPDGNAPCICPPEWPDQRLIDDLEALNPN